MDLDEAELKESLKNIPLDGEKKGRPEDIEELFKKMSTEWQEYMAVNSELT